MADRKSCGNCRYNVWNDEEQEYVCMNEESDEYEVPHAYSKVCKDYDRMD